MTNNKLISGILGIMISLSAPVMASTIESGWLNRWEEEILIEIPNVEDEIKEELQSYYDVSGMSFPFKEVPGGYVSPLQQKTKAISPFGQERWGYAHQGLDLVASIGTPLYAIADGVIIKAAPDSKGVDKGGGNMVFINHGNGIQSWYMHLSAYAVKPGDKVKAGDVVGFSGNTGQTTGPHFHYEYRINSHTGVGEPIDPSFIFSMSGFLDEEQSAVSNLTHLADNFFVPQG